MTVVVKIYIYADIHLLMYIYVLLGLEYRVYKTANAAAFSYTHQPG